jgi:hypothetical protein
MILTDVDGQTVCRDLWALHLSLLPDPPPAEPYLHARENVGTERGDPEDAVEQPPSSLPSEGFPSRLDSDQEAGSGDESDRNEEEGKQALNNDEDEEEDSELEALMRENSDLSSSSDEDETQGEPLPKKKGKKKGRSAEESPVSTIAVLVLGCWTLRIPVMYRDFSRHVLFGGLMISKAHERLMNRIIESYELPYLDPLRILPPSVVPHLTKDNIQALSPPVGKSHRGIIDNDDDGNLNSVRLKQGGCTLSHPVWGRSCTQDMGFSRPRRMQDHCCGGLPRKWVEHVSWVWSWMNKRGLIGMNNSNVVSTCETGCQCTVSTPDYTLESGTRDRAEENGGCASAFIRQGGT